MYDKRKDHPDPKRPPKRNRPLELQSHYVQPMTWKILTVKTKIFMIL